MVSMVNSSNMELRGQVGLLTSQQNDLSLEAPQGQKRLQRAGAVAGERGERSELGSIIAPGAVGR